MTLEAVFTQRSVSGGVVKYDPQSPARGTDLCLNDDVLLLLSCRSDFS